MVHRPVWMEVLGAVEVSHPRSSHSAQSYRSWRRFQVQVPAVCVSTFKRQIGLGLWKGVTVVTNNSNTFNASLRLWFAWSWTAVTLLFSLYTTSSIGLRVRHTREINSICKISEIFGLSAFGGCWLSSLSLPCHLLLRASLCAWWSPALKRNSECPIIVLYTACAAPLEPEALRRCLVRVFK